MKRYAAYLFDLDGTLYRGNAVIPHAADTLAELRIGGAAIRFLTNNSGTTPDAVADKLAGMGIAAGPEEVITSGMAAAKVAASQNLRDLFVIGEPGLVRTLRDSGARVQNADNEGRIQDHPSAECHAVVCGICRSFDYRLLNGAFQVLRGGARFIATNPDATYPMEGGRLEPGAGSLVAALRTCSGIEPFIAGKPSPEMVRVALASFQAQADEALVVGDRVDTDIAAGIAAGCPSVLVLTGVTESAPPELPAIEDLRGLLR